MSILFVLYCLFVLFGLIKKDSKLVTVMILAFAWILVGWNNGGPDYDNYVWRYEQNDTWFGVLMGQGVDYGYSILCYLGNSLHLSFEEFKIILSGISYLLIYSFLAKVGKRSALIASCYLLSFFLLDIIQIRNFFAMSVMLYGFRYLLEPGLKTKNIVGYVICALVASTIHISLIFSLLFVLTKFKLKWWYVIPAVAVLFAYKAFFYVEFSTQMDSEKLEQYRGVSSTMGGCYSMLIFLANAAFISWVVWNQKKKKNTNEQSFPFIDDVQNINIILLSLIPFLFDNASFSRLLKDVLIMNYAFLATQLRRKDYYLFYMYALFFLVQYVLGNQSRSQIFEAAFVSNSLL